MLNSPNLFVFIILVFHFLFIFFFLFLFFFHPNFFVIFFLSNHSFISYFSPYFLAFLILFLTPLVTVFFAFFSLLVLIPSLLLTTPNDCQNTPDVLLFDSKILVFNVSYISHVFFFCFSFFSSTFRDFLSFLFSKRKHFSITRQYLNISNKERKASYVYLISELASKIGNNDRGVGWSLKERERDLLAAINAIGRRSLAEKREKAGNERGQENENWFLISIHDLNV